MCVLITYFEPFDGDAINASACAAALLPEEICGHEIITQELPVVFQKAGERLRAAIERYHPALVLCLGQAEGSPALHLERVAINLRDASRPDNSGSAPQEAPIIAQGPAAYFTSLPVKILAQALRESGIPALVSNSAGTYVCNDVMYTLLHEQSKQDYHARGGFIHVPLTPLQAANRGGGIPSMDSGIAAQGLEKIIELCLSEAAGEMERI